MRNYRKLVASLIHIAVLAAVASASSTQDTIPFFQPGKVRVLIFSGRNNHDWRTTTPFLKRVLVA